MIRRAVVVAVCLLTGVGAASAGERAPGSDWAGFLGPTGDGKSTETGILASWKKTGPPLLWHVPTGEGYSAPAIADGRLFLFDRHADKARLTCIDPRTGDEVWRSEYATAYEDLYGFRRLGKSIRVSREPTSGNGQYVNQVTPPETYQCAEFTPKTPQHKGISSASRARRRTGSSPTKNA